MAQLQQVALRVALVAAPVVIKILRRLPEFPVQVVLEIIGRKVVADLSEAAVQESMNPARHLRMQAMGAVAVVEVDIQEKMIQVMPDTAVADM